MAPAPDDAQRVRSRPPESWMGAVRDDVRARLFDAADPDLAGGTSEPAARKIGRYVVIKRVGAGGMGMVYAAYDDQLDRKVAVKLLRPGHRRVAPHAQARLTREAQAIARLSHPSIIKVYEVGIHDGEVFVAMEYVDGPTLKQWQNERGWKDVLGRYLAAGRGLEAAHEAGIVHRDFKADNVLVRRDAPHRADGVRVLDFGLASTDPQDDGTGQTAEDGANAAPVTSLTHTGAVMGTPAYMAPEQHLATVTDGRTDQFSFCVSLFEALHGYRPFAGETLEELRANVLAGAVEDEPRYSEVPPGVSAALRRGLRVDPEERFASMRALLDELELDERPRWKRAAAGVGAAALVAVGVLQLGTTDTGDFAAEAARLRSQFETAREADAETELRALRDRTSPQRWGDLVLAYARERVSTDPTAALASLKHLRPSSPGWLDEGRVLAADAARRGPVYDAIHLSYPIERIVAPGPSGAVAPGTFLGISADGELLRLTAGNAGIGTAAIDLDGAAAVDAAWTSSGEFVAVTDTGMLLQLAADGRPTAPARSVGDVVRIAVSFDDSRLALGRTDGVVVVSDLQGNSPRELRGTHAPVTQLAFHAQRPTLASASEGTDVWMWFLERETHRTLEVHAPVERLAFDGEALVITTRDGGIHRDARTGTHRDPTWSEDVTDARVSADADVRIEATPTGLRARWGAWRQVALDRSHRPRDFAVSNDGGWAIASFASHLRAWDLRTDAHLTRATGERTQALDAAGQIVGLAPAGDGLLAYSAKGEVFRAHTSSSVAQASFQPTDAPSPIATAPAALAQIVPSPDGEQLVLVGVDGALYLTTTAHPDDIRPVTRRRPPQDGRVVWTPSGDALIECSCPRRDRSCELVRHSVGDTAGEGAERPRSLSLGTIPNRASIMRVSPDASHLLVGHRRRTMLWGLSEPNGGDSLEIPQAPWPVERTRIGLAFSAAGHPRVATSDVNPEQGTSTLRVWESFDEGTTPLELFVEAGLGLLRSTAQEDGLLLLTSDRRLLLWMLDEDRFHALPEALIPRLERERNTTDGDASEPTQFHVSPDRRRMWIAWGTGGATLVQLDTGHARTLPTLTLPVAWTAEGAIADVARLREIRLWTNPAPDAPEPFLRWIDARTRISIATDDMLSPN